MTKNSKKLYTGIFIVLVFFIIFLLTWRLNRQVVKPIPIIETTANIKIAIPSSAKKPPTKTQILNPIISATPEKENAEKVTLILGNQIINLSFEHNTLFYDALAQAKDEGKIIFSGKNYPGLGFFVTDIGTLHAGNGKNLLYYINGKQASVGVSSYTLKDGDIIEWKLE